MLALVKEAASLSTANKNISDQLFIDCKKLYCSSA